jgi:hypothetical protein
MKNMYRWYCLTLTLTISYTDSYYNVYVLRGGTICIKIILSSIYDVDDDISGPLDKVYITCV